MSPVPAVVTVTLNPAIDQTLSIPDFTPGAVNRVVASRSNVGGKGVNVASILADLGVDVAATGFLGQCNAELFDDWFRRKSIQDGFVRIPGSTRVGIKIADDRQQQTTDINFPGLSPDAEAVQQLFRQIEAFSKPGCWFVLSGSVPKGLQPDIYGRLTELIRAGGGRVAVDTSGPPLRCAIKSAPDVVKPNVAELEELSGRVLSTPEEIADAALSLRRDGVGLVVVSMGDQGAWFVDGETMLRTRPPQVTVKSTVGAGDAMVSGLVYAQMKGFPLRDCARLATALGAYAVTRFDAGAEWPQIERYREGVVVEYG